MLPALLAFVRILSGEREFLFTFPKIAAAMIALTPTDIECYILSGAGLNMAMKRDWVWFRRLGVFALVCTFASIPQAAQGTLADYQRAEHFLPGNLRHSYFAADVLPHWIGHTARFWYRRVGPNSIQFILVDADRNTSGPAFDQPRLAAALTRASKHEYDASDLPLEKLQFTAGGKSIRFALDNTPWTCSLTDYDCKAGPEENRYEVVSPNGMFAAFVKNHNLYLRDVSSGEIVQLTRDGAPSDDYATPLPSLTLLVEQETEKVKQRPAVFWSPDSSKLATYRLDSRNAGRFTSLQYVPPHQLRPKAFTYVYPLPGEVLAKAEPIIFDVPSLKRIDVKTPPIFIPFQDGPYFDWFPDSKSFFYTYDSRGVKSIELRVVNADSGTQTVVIREQSDKYIDPGETFFRFDHATGEVLYTSERSGWNQLYLSKDSGQLENAVTQGDWVVRRIEHVDDTNRRVYFLASDREKNEDPYLTHLYSVGFDGQGLTLLTPENANHSVSISPDGNYFVDNYSRVDFPGESVLRRTKDASVVRVLEKSNVTGLLKSGWKYPIPFKGKAGDRATDLYGLIWRPSNFNPAKKYPIIEQVYTGPQGFFVPKTFAAALRGPAQAIAELGFIVVMVDGRGTAGRSRAFHQFSYHNLGNVFGDHVTMIEQMAKKYPYMDINRVGIYGTSAGGYGSAHATLMYPDFYKVCVSISGDHDARLDKAWWNELYQGYPVGKDYTQQSNVTNAYRLKGHLLLMHGDVDPNVNPVETMRFVNALIKANKNFDMLFVPNMFHGEGGNLYLLRRQWDYFVQNLLGVTPPANFEIKEAKQPPRERRR